MTADLNFHDSHLADYMIGPRHEVSLEIALDPVWNPTAGGTVTLRVGAIDNFPVVQEFFQRIPQGSANGRFLAAILRFEQTSKNLLVIELDRFGLLEIYSSKVTLQAKPLKPDSEQ